MAGRPTAPETTVHSSVMISDAGFTVEGVDEHTLPAARHDLVAIRRRGAGTDLPANA